MQSVMDFNATSAYALPPLPAWELKPLPPLVPWISDKHLTLLLPIVAYWAVSMVFHVIDVYDLFPEYRLHTPAELLQRNHVSRWDVFRDVIVQQIIQTIFGIVMTTLEPADTYGKEAYDVTVWAQRVRLAQRALPALLSFIGVDAGEAAKRIAGSHPMIAGALQGGLYPGLLASNGAGHVAPAFADWEMLVAQIIYHVVVPFLQFALGVLIVDTWQYFWHRGMHMNKWMYNKFHSRHHRLYVPYAYGALYNHPVEGFLLDTLGTGVAYMVAGMTTRQSMWFFTCSTIKTVDDHCGYALPWDPLQHLTSNNAAYHDIHHQSWGIKTNFSQPFLTFWDRFLGTMWSGGDVSLRYARTRLAAEAKSVAVGTPSDTQTAGPYEQPSLEDIADQASLKPSIPAGKPTAQAVASRNQVLEQPEGAAVVAEETAEEVQLRRSPRKRTPPANVHSGSLKGLKHRVSGSLPNGVPRVDSRR
ncbi:putative sphinganine hydroxylase Sur2 [Trichodelitschia bisporula]|uniref:Putative sphinganine hydroxylase Sur2 n=1 Tax=Trichodelitschia bisporula TaxID=703511 RepID=A0A6G1HJY4_9PEZI|nr:putative sphinganine hydroxylase Sur2 [Trichodelitschia bisporula]